MMVYPRKAQIFLFITILLENFTGFRSETTVSVRLHSFQSYKPCDRTCDFSFEIYLTKRCLKYDHCFYNGTFMGPFPNQNPVIFAQSTINPVIAHVPDNKDDIYLRVKVIERGTYRLGYDRLHGDWDWAQLGKRFDIIPVGIQSQTLQIASSRTRLTFELSTLCTPPLYVSDGACTKFCEIPDDLSGQYICTVNGDKECKPGRKCQLSTTPFPVTQNQAMSTSVPASGKDIALPVRLAIGLLILIILVVVLIVFLIRRRKRKNKNNVDTPGISTLADQRESRNPTSNETHSNPYVMDESTFTNNNGALPADGVHSTLDTPTGAAVLPPYRVSEIPGPRDSLYLEDNVTYESSGNGGTVEEKATTYENLPE